MKLGVALGWHVHPWEELLALVRLAEDLGYTAAFVDGDVSMLGERRETPALNGWTVTTALLGQTSRIQIGSLRLVHHWNPAQLAQAVATAERLWPGRLRFFASIGGWSVDARFGLLYPPPSDRIRMLDETLASLRALWRGGAVSSKGPGIRLDGARVRPTPPGGRIPIAVAAKGKALLEVVAAHADIWDVNLPPIPARVARAEAQLSAACRARSRDPAEITRSMWIFTRVGAEAESDEALLAEYRRLNPWFGGIPDAEVSGAWIAGDAAECRRRLAELRRSLSLELPILDLSGLAAEPSERVLSALAPGK